MRENEIITKQFHYAGIAVTNDCSRIYAITSESSIKIFHHTDLEQECTVENHFLPSAICLSKSERFLYIGMTNGIIRVYTIPLTFDTYVDVPAHYSSIRRLLVSYDDRYLVSIAESAYILLFKQTIDVCSSISNQYQFSQLSQENLERTNEQERTAKKFDYILVTKSEFDDQKRKIQEIQAKLKSVSSFSRIDSHSFDIFRELETENNLKLRSKQITFSKHLNHSSQKFQSTMKQLLSTYEELKTEIASEKFRFQDQTKEMQEKYDGIQNQTEVLYENQMLETVLLRCRCSSPMSSSLCFSALTYSQYSAGIGED